MINVTNQLLQNDLLSLMGAANHVVKEYWGHAWTYIEKLPIYTENHPYAAYVGLTLTFWGACEIAKLALYIFNVIFPISEEGAWKVNGDFWSKENVIEKCRNVIGFGIIAGSLALFFEATKLQQTRAVLGVFLANVAVRCAIRKYYEF